jgi:tRNA threonylcarbamoyladenosine biosynthesis protein TsaE
MDVYRLDSIDEFLDLGVEDMLYGDGICIIEWSEKISETLPDSTITISISIPDTTDQRVITIKNWPYGDIE